jgi:hypothetical protein
MGVEDQALLLLLLLLLLLVGLGDSLYYLLLQILQSRHLGVQMRKRLDPQDSLTRHETGKSNAFAAAWVLFLVHWEWHSSNRICRVGFSHRVIPECNMPGWIS